jgi:DNA-binding NtrC family response regulator
MLEAIQSEGINGNKSGNEQVDSPDSLDLQIRVLREVAFNLLRQLDVINRASHLRRAKDLHLHNEVREFEIELISSALAQTHGHQVRAAGLLGIKVTTLNAKVKRYKIMPRFYVPLNETTGKS